MALGSSGLGKKRWTELSFCHLPTRGNLMAVDTAPYDCVQQAIFSGGVTKGAGKGGRLSPLLRTRGGIATPRSIMSVHNIDPCSGPIMKVNIPAIVFTTVLSSYLA